VDSGRCVGELIGLRQALVSGLRSGTISAAASGQNDVEAPHTFNAQTLEADFPIDGPPVAVHQLAAALQDRTAATADFLRDVVEYVLDQTDAEIGRASCRERVWVPARAVAGQQNKKNVMAQ